MEKDTRMFEFGRNVAAERVRRGMTQGELAVKSGMCRGAIQSIETGVRKPSLRTALAIADALGIGIEELVG